MKKFATLMLALVMLISCAAIGMAEDITLDVIICQYGTQTNDWFTGTGMNGTSFVKKFEEANPGIKLNLEVVSWNDVYTVVSTRISNNNAPDILNLDSFADYANEGLLLPVKDYCPEELFNDFFPSFIAQSVIDDTVWAVPDLASARALYYNVDLLEAAGVEVPTTWAELEDVCQALVDFYGGDVYPWGIDMTTDEGQAAFAYYAWGNGGGFVDDEDNWNHTHRFAGYVWIIAGVVTLLSVFLGHATVVWFAAIFVASLSPLVYSFIYAKRHGKI